MSVNILDHVLIASYKSLNMGEGGGVGGLGMNSRFFDESILTLKEGDV